MPSVSKKQHNLMAMVANDPAAAKRMGIPKSVGEDFVQADKGLKFGKGSSRADLQKANRPDTRHGKSELFSRGGDMKKVKKMAFGGMADPAAVAAANAAANAGNAGGSMRGLEQAAAMSGRAMPVLPSSGGRPMPTLPAGAAAMNQAGNPQFKRGGSVKKMATGGKPTSTGLARAAEMSGRTMPTTGRPASTGLARAAEMSGRTMPTTGKPVMKKGGAVKKMASGGVTRADGIVSKGHTKGKQVAMKRGGKC